MEVAVADGEELVLVLFADMEAAPLTLGEPVPMMAEAEEVTEAALAAPVPEDTGTFTVPGTLTVPVRKPELVPLP